jgi:predicted oxidoreductase
MSHRSFKFAAKLAEEHGLQTITRVIFEGICRRKLAFVFLIMQKIKLHPSGPALSRMVVGAWRWHAVSSQQIETLIKTSLAEGITSFDHADIYGDYSCEEAFGNVLRRNTALRNEMELVTKCGIKLLSDKRPNHRIKHYDTSKKHIVWSAENSLKMLATDRIDILLLHRPDPLLNPVEVAEAFASLKQQGKVLHFGVSNFNPSQLEMLQSYLPFPLVTNQIELSLFNHQDFFNGVVDTLTKHRICPMAWSPLGGGKHFDDNQLQKQLEDMAGHYHSTPTQLLLAWLLTHPAIIFPILGTTKPERIEESAQSVTLQLDRQHWFEMLKWVTRADVA